MLIMVSKSILRSLSSRELTSSSSSLRNANWAILRELVTGKNLSFKVPILHRCNLYTGV